VWGGVVVGWVGWCVLGGGGGGGGGGGVRFNAGQFGPYREIMISRKTEI